MLKIVKFYYCKYFDMKTIVTFSLSLLFLFFASDVKSQKIRDKAISVKYVQLPKKRLPDDYKTYSVAVRGASFQQAGTSPQEYAKRIGMDGFKRLSGIGRNSGHLRVEIDGGYISNGEAEYKTGTTKSKDKDGNEITTKYYFYSVPFSSNTSFRIIDPNGQILSQGNYPLNEIVDSERYTSSSSLIKAKARIVNELGTEYAEDVNNNLYSRVSQSLKYNFDYDKTKARPELFLIKNHSSEGQFEKHFQHAKRIFEQASYQTSSAELIEQLTPAIDFYSGHAAKDPRGDKKKKRIYRAANYNLAILYYYTDQFDLAEDHCRNVLASEGKDLKSKRLIEKIERQKTSMTAVGIHTLHYDRDLESALPPAELAALQAEKEELIAETTTTKGVVHIGREIIVGTLSLDKDAEDMVFGDGGNVRFMVEEGPEMKEIDLLDQAVTEFEIADRKFKKVRFSPSAKGKQDASLQILEEIYASDQIKLFKYYPSSGALSDEKPEFAFKKRMQEFPISLESTQFLIWKKGLSNYFLDCPDLSEMCLEGDLKKNKEDLIKAARIYSELCVRVIKP